MADAWDAEDFEPQPIEYRRPEEIAAEEAAKNELAEAESKEKESKKQVKAKPMKSKFKHGSGEPERELTAKEREELQRKTDLGLAKDLFGGDGEDDAIPYSELKTSLDFTEFAENLSAKLATRQKADLYPAFISHLMYKLCNDMDSKNVRKLSNELKALADSKANEEKSKKTSSKPTLKPTAPKGVKTGSGAKVYDDFLDGSGTGAADYGGYDDDDFM